MKPKPKSLTQVFNEKWPSKNAAKQSQNDDYISRLRHELALYLPKQWQNKVKINKYQQGILHLTFDNAAHKMRFNSVRLDLLSHLRQLHPELISIKESVKPASAVPQTASTAVTTSPKKAVNIKKMSTETAENLKSMATTLPDNLRDALESLIKKGSE